jgi:HEPN domain-containing protein
VLINIDLDKWRLSYEKRCVIKHWINSADNDYPVMATLFEKGHYNWSLFLGHLILEKILKACYVK